MSLITVFAMIPADGRLYWRTEGVKDMEQDKEKYGKQGEAEGVGRER